MSAYLLTYLISCAEVVYSCYSGLILCGTASVCICFSKVGSSQTSYSFSLSLPALAVVLHRSVTLRFDQH